jgi:hypothetical protein
VRQASAASACAAVKFPTAREDVHDVRGPPSAKHCSTLEPRRLQVVALAGIRGAADVPTGWAAWGLNPTGEAMGGIQALKVLGR